MSQVNRLFRHAVGRDVKSAKFQVWIESLGIWVPRNQVSIDHYPLPYLRKDVSYDYIKELAPRFREFHGIIARYRLMPTQINHFIGDRYGQTVEWVQ